MDLFARLYGDQQNTKILSWILDFSRCKWTLQFLLCLPIADFLWLQCTARAITTTGLLMNYSEYRGFGWHSFKWYSTRHPVCLWNNIETLSRNHCCSGGGDKYYIFWVCVCSLIYPACDAHAPYCQLWPAPLYNIFPHCLIKVTTFGKRIIEHKICFDFLYNFGLKLFFSFWEELSEICSKMYIGLHVQVPVILVRFQLKLNILDRFWKYTHLSIFTKISAVGTELFHADKPTDRHDEANGHFSQFCESAWKLLSN